MPKSGRRAGRRRANALPARDTRPVLDRILDTPHIAHVIPRLQPEVLHRVIQTFGLEDCGEIVALATADQLTRVFDLDLWRSRQPGVDEHFDPDRFGVWLEMLVDCGARVAAQVVAKMNVDLVIAGFAQHMFVFDRAARSLSEPGYDVGGYLVVARRTGSWDAIIAVLLSLEAEQHDYFHRVMRGCRRLSNSGFELDGLHDLSSDREQVMFDLAFAREHRREQQGYVTPAEARAFLQMSRQLRLGQDTTPPASPLAHAYFRAIERTAEEDARPERGRLPAASGAPLAPDDSRDAVAAVVEILLEAGVLPRQPRALLDGPQSRPPRLAQIHAQMEVVRSRDHDAHSMRTQELAYLANTILAGCSFQARAFTPQEASDAAVAVCNLGLQHWSAAWRTAPSDDVLLDHDLIGVFQVGWTVLHNDVCTYAADRLVEILTAMRCEDREIQHGLDALRLEMTTHGQAGAPWRARDALDVIAILDMPAWATLLGLIDECPVIHAAMAASRDSRTRSVSASAFEFISENSQIAAVREFMQSLPETLRR